jgi:hypothetical protein
MDDGIQAQAALRGRPRSTRPPAALPKDLHKKSADFPNKQNEMSLKQQKKKWFFNIGMNFYSKKTSLA